jgi:transposase
MISVPEQSQSQSASAPQPMKSALEQAKATVHKAQKLLSAWADSEDGRDHTAYTLFAAGISKELQPVETMRANDQLLDGEAGPLVRREDGLGNSLARLKPRIETGSGKGNPKTRAKKQRIEQENVPTAAEIIAKPTAPRARNIAHHLELAIEKEARRKGRQPGPSFSAQASQGVQPCPLTADLEPAMMLPGVRVPAHN